MLLPVQCWCCWHLLATDNCMEFHTDGVKCVCTCLCVCTYQYVCVVYKRWGQPLVTHYYSINRHYQCVCVGVYVGRSGAGGGKEKCGAQNCWTSTEGRGVSGVELCSKDTAVNTSTHVTEEVKCRWGSVQCYTKVCHAVFYTIALLSRSSFSLMSFRFISCTFYVLMLYLSCSVLPSSANLRFQRMGPVSRFMRRCLWVGSCGVPPPRPPTSWPLTLGRGARHYAQAWMGRSSSPKIMFVYTPQSPCLAWQSTTQVSPHWFSNCIFFGCECRCWLSETTCCL